MENIYHKCIQVWVTAHLPECQYKGIHFHKSSIFTKALVSEITLGVLYKDCIPIEIVYNIPHNINIYLTERARFEDRIVDYTRFFTHTLSLYSIPPYKIVPTSLSKLSRELLATFQNRLFYLFPFWIYREQKMIKYSLD